MRGTKRRGDEEQIMAIQTAHTKPETYCDYLDWERESSLRKHAYSNILKILLPKNENFQLNISDIFHISAQNIDCGYSLEPHIRGGSNEYPQFMF